MHRKIASLVLIAGVAVLPYLCCRRGAPQARTDAPDKRVFTLAARRKALHTKIFMNADKNPAPGPPPEIFTKVKYAAPLGEQVAYVTPQRTDGRHPAVVEIQGGFGFGLDEEFWRIAPRDNDQ